MITWTIATLERELSDGGVIVAHWRATGEETDVEITYSSSSYVTCGFTYDPADPSFVPYGSLTEADVLGWVWNEVDRDAIEAALTADIESEKNPTTADGVPW